MHLLFDLDGTLTNPQLGIFTCICHALTTLDMPIPAEPELALWIGPPLYDSFFALLGDRARAAQAVTLYRNRFATVGLYENAVYADIPTVLATLTEHHVAWVCTSKPQVFACKIVEHFDLRDFFAGVYGSELNGDRARKSDLIAHLLQQENIPTNAAVMIGDRHYDVAGGRHHGLATLGVTWGFGSVAELTAAGAKRLCHHPTELPKVIRTLAADHDPP
ncbi:MAG: HAD hydrolase-like protein [Leptolyngbyaceae cyanobacterium]